MNSLPRGRLGEYFPRLMINTPDGYGVSHGADIGQRS
jgi:hypothetical protein